MCVSENIDISKISEDFLNVYLSVAVDGLKHMVQFIEDLLCCMRVMMNACLKGCIIVQHLQICMHSFFVYFDS